MVASVDTRSGRRRVWSRPPAWGELSLGAVSGGLLVTLAFGLAFTDLRDRSRPPASGGEATAPVLVGQLFSEQRRQEARRRFEAFASEADLSAPARRSALLVLGDLQETWAGALGYFEALEEGEGDRWAPVGLLAPGHAQELEQLLAAAAAVRLSRTLGPAAAALAEKRLAPLGSFLASAPSAP